MSPAFTRSRAGLLLALTAGSGISPPGAPARTSETTARAALGASASARPGVVPGRASSRTSRGVDDPPQVWFTPAGGTVAAGTQTVTVHWCDDTGFLSGTRQIKLDGATLSSTFAVSAYPACTAHATSDVSLNLTASTHTISARITDRGSNVGSSDAQYDAVASPLTVTLVSPALYRDPALCALACGEVVQTFGTPAYVSRDVPRSLTLVCRSGRARPLAVVEVDVTAAPAGTARLGLALRDVNGAAVALTHGAAEVVRVD